MRTLSNVKKVGGDQKPNSVRFAPDAFPEAKSSQTGVSVKYVESPEKKWYVFIASYGREDKAFDYLVEDGTYTYIAKKLVERFIRGKRERYFKSLIPNLLFVYTTEKKAEDYIHNTHDLFYLSYYYDHFKFNNEHKNPPLVIPSNEMKLFIQTTSNRNKHLLFVKSSQCHFKSRDLVKVVDGPFAGVEGMVARVAGQKRVVVSLSHLGLISTAYIPEAFLRRINSESVI